MSTATPEPLDDAKQPPRGNATTQNGELTESVKTNGEDSEEKEAASSAGRYWAAKGHLVLGTLTVCFGWIPDSYCFAISAQYRTSAVRYARGVTR